MNRFDYRFHADLNLLEVRPAGVVHVTDILAYATEALSQGLVREGTVEYYDLSGMTNFGLDYESACALTEKLQEWLAHGWHGSVFFTPQDYQFGIIRMIGAVAGSIDGAPEGMMIPRREPVPLDKVRHLVSEHRETT